LAYVGKKRTRAVARSSACPRASPLSCDQTHGSAKWVVMSTFWETISGERPSSVSMARRQHSQLSLTLTSKLRSRKVQRQEQSPSRLPAARFRATSHCKFCGESMFVPTRVGIVPLKGSLSPETPLQKSRPTANGWDSKGNVANAKATRVHLYNDGAGPRDCEPGITFRHRPRLPTRHRPSV
jgi:hypothetical protein